VTNTCWTVEFFIGDFTACPLDIVSTFEPNVCSVPSNGSSYIFHCSGQSTCASSILPPGVAATTTAPQIGTTSVWAYSTDPTTTSIQAANTGSTTTSTQAANTGSTTSSSSASNKALITGLTVPLAIMVAVVGFLLYWFVWRRLANKKANRLGGQRNAGQSIGMYNSGAGGGVAQRQTHELDSKPQMHELQGLPQAHELEGSRR
jgi:hypothetical protein